ncbi:MAG: hypothetical protein VX768_11950 [Planctomycetota bacterium]|nr:hypothetical protein [Planctomycetota bacterium]
MKKFLIATLVSAAMLFTELTVFGQQISVTRLSVLGEWAVAPDSSGLVVTTSADGFAEYLVEYSTDYGDSSAIVSVTESGYFIDEMGDSAAFLVVPHVLQRNQELAFGIRLVCPDSDEWFDLNSTSSSLSQSWLDECYPWVEAELGSGWQEPDSEMQNYAGFYEGGDVSANGSFPSMTVSCRDDNDDDDLPWWNGGKILRRWLYGSAIDIRPNIEQNKRHGYSLDSIKNENGIYRLGGANHVDEPARNIMEGAAEGNIEIMAGGGVPYIGRGGISRRVPNSGKPPIVGPVRQYDEATKARIPGYDNHHLDPKLGRVDPDYPKGPTIGVRNDNAGGRVPGGVNLHTGKGGFQTALTDHIKKDLGFTIKQWNDLPDATRKLHLRRYCASLGIPFPF